MFALMSGWLDRARAAANGAAGSVTASGVVLPRVFRRPARFASRLFGGDVDVPRYYASIGTAGLLLLTGLYGAYAGGHIPALVQGATARLGFAIDEVRVVGNVETSEIDILDRLQLDGWTSLIGFDADAARERIARLPWVDMVSVRKIYPAAIEVRMEEKQAFALWQHGREVSIVDHSGAVIAPFNAGRHRALPLVIGLGAAESASDFVALVKAHPELSARVKGYIRIAERRWNLRLENGVTVKLPAEDEAKALEDLVAMDAKSGLLSRDIASVDMRIADRLVVQLTPDAALRREAALKEQAKALKKRGQRI